MGVGRGECECWEGVAWVLGVVLRDVSVGIGRRGYWEGVRIERVHERGLVLRGGWYGEGVERVSIRGICG